MPNIAFIGFTVSEAALQDVARRNSLLPVQTHRFAWNLVEAFNQAGCNVRLVSALPVQNYPEFPDLVVRGARFYENETHGLTLSFVNVLALKHLTRLYSALTAGQRFLRDAHCDVAVVHGVHSPFLLFALALQRRNGMPIFLVLTDPPALVRANDGWITRWLKAIDRKVVRTLANRFDGVLALTEDLAKDFAPKAESLVFEGFAPTIGVNENARPDRAAPVQRIAYAGGVSEEYGVGNLVRAFASIADPSLRLHIYGKGPLDAWVHLQAESDPRISHFGVTDHSSLLTALSSAAVLVNPRPANQDFTRYSFPSKLLEYMALGVPVVTTRLAGIPAEYDQFVEWADGDSHEALGKAISAVINSPTAARERSERAKQFVASEKSIAAQGRKIWHFIDEIRSPAI